MNQRMQYAESFLTDLLAAYGMDIDYVRAVRNTLYYRKDGADVPVLDLVGGWGSLMLGHNHPRINARAKELLDTQTPVHSQLSTHSVADQVGKLLNEILHRELPGSEDHAIVFANSGAEAIEVAVKHAELDRLLRVKAFFEDMEWNIGMAIGAVATGQAQLPDTMPDGQEPPSDVDGLIAALTALAGQNVAQLGKPPVIFALERAFHGKLVGSVQLTHNPIYREAFQALGRATTFVPPGEPEALKQLIEDNRVIAYDVAIIDGRVTVVEKDYPIFTGFLVEPIQGEGGIHPLTPEYATAIRELCDQVGCPIIVDEIQSGMGRSGAFFASSRNGLRGDYYTLGKSLGGGIAKVSATLVRKSVYRKEFELLHSSTFAKDGFSTAIALESLRILEANGGAAYRVAAARGERIVTALREVAGRFPDVVQDVRGQGLLVGIEFTDQSNAPSATIRDKARAGTLSYLLAAYLLLVHRIRIGPTASAPNVLRIEPSIYLSDAEIDQLTTGIEALCEILRASDALHLIHPIATVGSAKPRVEVKEFQAVSETPAETGEGVKKVAFISYQTEPALLRELDPSLAELSDADLTSWVQRHELFKEAAPLAPVRIESPRGSAVELTVYPMMVTPAQLWEYRASGRLDGIRADIDARVRAAKADGCEFAGLGFGLATVTDGGTVLRVPQIAVSSGGALTVASALTALRNAAQQRFGGFDGLTIAVLGGTGRIGSACAELASETFDKVIVIRQGNDLSVLKDAHLVLSATSAPVPFLTDEHFRDDAVICDLAVPSSISVSDKLLTVSGGVLATPNGSSLPPGARGTLGVGQIHASAAEAVVLGLAGIGYGYASGVITREQVNEMANLAEQHGFTQIT